MLANDNRAPTLYDLIVEVRNSGLSWRMSGFEFMIGCTLPIKQKRRLITEGKTYTARNRLVSQRPGEFTEEHDWKLKFWKVIKLIRLQWFKQSICGQ